MSHALVFLHLLHTIYNSWSFTSALALLCTFFFSGPFVSSNVSILKNYAGAQNSGFHVLSRMAVLHIKSFAKRLCKYLYKFQIGPSLFRLLIQMRCSWYCHFMWGDVGKSFLEFSAEKSIKMDQRPYHSCQLLTSASRTMIVTHSLALAKLNGIVM